MLTIKKKNKAVPQVKPTLKHVVRKPPRADLDCIEFALMDPDDIRKMSVCQITEAKMREISLDVENVNERVKTYTNTLKDERMGTIEHREECITCGELWDVCPGHPGHIELGRYIVHPLMVKFLIKMLNCICHKCASCYLSTEQLDLFLPEIKQKEKMERLDVIVKYCSDVKVCKSHRVITHGEFLDSDSDDEDEVSYPTQCNEPRFHYWIDDKNHVFAYFKKKEHSVEVSPYELHRLLSAITCEDSIKLGLNPGVRPEWMIIDVINVLPPCSRPYVMAKGLKHEDDLTYKYSDIIKIINKLKDVEDDEKKGKNVTMKKQELINNLNYNVATLMDNSKNKAKPNSGKPYKGIQERISGKKGLFRAHLRGKRVDYSARTVIGGDPMLRIDEIGIPKKIADTITTPEMVTHFNIYRLAKLIEDGRVNTVIKELPNGQKQQIMVEYAKDIELVVGDTVLRYIQDGDLLEINRQPTLHKQSMVGGRAKILPGSHFRISLTITPPLNADFDGDRHLFCPQQEA